MSSGRKAAKLHHTHLAHALPDHALAHDLLLVGLFASAPRLSFARRLDSGRMVVPSCQCNETGSKQESMVSALVVWYYTASHDSRVSGIFIEEM